MQNIELYIEGQRLDLFNDESVSLTQTIKNARDVAKVFTSFTQTFNVPASKTNNKIFKHFYNFDIVNGFDARTKKSGTIELNSFPFKDGKIKLEGVSLKENQAHSYKITFFGKAVNLKDLVGDDKLNQLSSLSVFDLDYNSLTVKSKLQADPATNDIIAPLITHTERLYYKSSTNTGTDGNLWYHTGSGQVHEHGVIWSELKYAIRVSKIVAAIGIRYGISFSDDFFNTSNASFYNLFLWLHRKKGNVENAGGLAFSNIVNGWANVSKVKSSIINTTTLKIDNSNLVLSAGLGINRTETHPFDIVIKRNGQTVVSATGVTAQNSSYAIPAALITTGAEFTVSLSYAQTLNFTNIRWSVAYADEGLGGTDTFDTGVYQATSDFEFVITQQVPEIKVIDFLTGLFKMFNLVAYVEQADFGLSSGDVIVVKTLDSFYSSYSSYDISSFIDVSKSQVNLALPYREIVFKYEDTKTLLSAKHEQLFNYQWAAEDYRQTDEDGNNLDGGSYNVKLPFSHLKYERLYDSIASSNTNIQVGYNVDDNQEPYIGKPVLFYPIRLTSSTTPASTSISFRDDLSSHSELTNYIIPSNSIVLDPSVSSDNINFKNELNEFTGNTDFTNTLFKKYYSSYITNIFNSKNRLTKVTAYLPLKILLNFTLADRFDINGQRYKINSIKTNLKTGKSDIELLNEL